MIGGETGHCGLRGRFTVEEQNDSDSGPGGKKMKKTDSACTPVTQSDKIFQKSSSPLRHKYEHTASHVKHQMLQECYFLAHMNHRYSHCKKERRRIKEKAGRAQRRTPRPVAEMEALEPWEVQRCTWSFPSWI
ncbi:zinc finger E-box-binding homeobox 1 isoform X2 [Lates japonicus]|uniref:Zinc finger E-box-binding homeobox 1 isoform X2 n=1 Tax=Lates japonicus TaxID=270547 RepID=A0AAD3NMX4_LATJO|nr:zinc finger E-box-binding homeobox 1 isoform X2 [Lates japonicus]